MELKKRACGVSRQYWSQIKKVLPLIFFLFMKQCYTLNLIFVVITLLETDGEACISSLKPSMTRDKSHGSSAVYYILHGLLLRVN